MARVAIVAFLLVFTVSGCGTVGNLWACCGKSGGDRIYGGVCQDVKLAWEGVAQGFNPDEDGPWFPPAAICLFTLDLPLSAIGDTLTLPITIPATLGQANSADSPKADPKGDQAQGPISATAPCE
jgi:uncharacterized protein YceK